MLSWVAIYVNLFPDPFVQQLGYYKSVLSKEMKLAVYGGIGGYLSCGEERTDERMDKLDRR